MLIVSLFVGCNGVDIKPEPATSSSSSSSSSESASSSSGNGGAGGAHMGAGGSGGTSCNPCGNKNGSRIVAKLKTTTTPDGLHWEEQIGWYDTDLGANCKPTLAEDKKKRCLPTDVVMVNNPDPTTYIYSDSNCTQRVVEGYVPTCEPVYTYALETAGAGLPCVGTPMRVYSLLGGNPLSMIYKKPTGQCVQANINPGGNGYYYVDKIVPATTFAEISETNTP